MPTDAPPQAFATEPSAVAGQRFLKPLPRHWHPNDLDLTAAATPPDPAVLHVTKTVALLESRADRYADYLLDVFAGRERPWLDATARWNFEERQHGIILRRLAEAGDPGFRFEDCMAEYEARVPYHEHTGESVRGSVAAELVCRCVVEALASTLYRVLADAATDEPSRAVFTTLARDEARHFGMFAAMLDAEEAAVGRVGVVRKSRTAIGRMLEVEDAQIMAASMIVGGRPATAGVRREANFYLSLIYGRYRRRHAAYAARMLLQTVGMRRSRPVVAATAAGLLAGIKARWLPAAAATRLSGPRLPG